ncbi:MAG TPA: redoxin domain-containing protein [Terriglobales bacterium]|nr:redoxin domain-containing protein [Terriglobales bacterium]
MRGILASLVLAFSLNTPTAYGQNIAKDFSLPSVRDNTLIRLSDYSGKVVLINWWRTNCKWSQAEAPKLVALYKKYQPKGFVIIGISDDTADTVAQAPAYLQKYGVTWPVGYNDQAEFMRDIRPLGQGDTPGNYLVSRSGKIRYLGLDRSPDAWQRIESSIEGVLAEPVPAKSPIIRSEPTSAPDFDLTDLLGKHVQLKDLRGKPALVNFFNSQQTCDWAEPAVVKVNQSYKSRGFQVVGIDVGRDTDQSIQGCKTKYSMTFPILHGTDQVQQAWIGNNSAWAAFFVTPDGKVFKMIRDSIDNGLEGTVFSKYAEYMLSHK